MTCLLEQRLHRRGIQGNLRELQLRSKLIDFSSNDYLGLANSPDLFKGFQDELVVNKLGSTGSRLLTGNSTYAEELERQVAAFHGYKSALLFSCGYMANMGLFSAIGSTSDAFFFDVGIHASTREGMCLSKASAFPFKHNDVNHLESRLKNSPSKGEKFICVESIYSTDGTKAPLESISQLAEKYGAHLIVDEAHASGICGPQGRGLVSELGLTSKVFALIVTFGKALGVQGAIVLGSSILKQSLLNFALPCIYTTALPFYALAAIEASYRLFPKLESERKHLQSLIDLFCQHYQSESETAVQPVRVKGNKAAKELSKRLSLEGFDVRALMSPTVQKGQERLRICLHAFNTKEEVLELLTQLKKHV